MTSAPAQWLRDLRARTGLTQEELAEASGISDRTVRVLEAGEVIRPHRDTLRRLAEALLLAPEDASHFVEAWREDARGPRAIEQMFVHPPSATLTPAEMAREREQLRDVSTVEYALIGADRELRRIEVAHTVEALRGGIGRYLWVTGAHESTDLDALEPSWTRRCRAEQCYVFAPYRAKAFSLRFDHPLERGELYSFAYAIDFAAAQRSPVPDVPETEILLGYRATAGFMSLEVEFDEVVRPARLHRVDQATLDDVPHTGAEVPLGRDAVASIAIERPGAGVHGLAWTWS